MSELIVQERSRIKSKFKVIRYSFLKNEKLIISIRVVTNYYLLRNENHFTCIKQHRYSCYCNNDVSTWRMVDLKSKTISGAINLFH